MLHYKRNRIYAFDKTKFHGLNLGSSTASPERWISVSAGTSTFFASLPKMMQRTASLFLCRRYKTKAKELETVSSGLKFIHHDLMYVSPFKKNSIPYVYSSHFFEHITYSSARFVSDECFRVLEPGGLLRIVIPSLDVIAADLQAAIKKYHETESAEYLIPFITTKYRDFIDRYSNHRYIYNARKLKELLLNSGFIHIREYQRNQGSFSDLEKLEIRGGLIVEASKPKDN